MTQNASLDDIVLDINVSLSAAAVTRAGFGTVLIAGRNASFSERLQFFTTLAAVALASGLSSSTPEYYAAREAFATGIDRVAIGRMTARVAQVHTFEITTAADGVWTITIDDVEYTYTASGSAAASVVAAGLRAAVNATDVTITAAGSSAIITLTSDIAGRGFTATITPAGAGVASSTATTANVSVGDQLDAIQNEENDWYGLVLASRVDEDMLQAASWVESEGHKIFIGQSSTAGILLTATTDDVASVMQDRSYTRSFIAWHATGTEALDAGWMASVLQADLDTQSTTFAFQTIAGVATDAISVTQRGAGIAKNVGLYLKMKGVGSTYQGKSAGGGWLDETMIADWFDARIAEGVAQALLDASARHEKIAHTDEGYAVFEAIVRGVYETGVAAGHFRDNTLLLDMPTRDDVSDASVTARTYAFSGSVGLAGAVHGITFNVTASAT